MKLTFIIPPILILFSSCYSYKINPKELRNYTYSGKKQKVYVLNPELKKEYKILEDSTIFEITSDSADKTMLNIKLHPFKKRLACGQLIMGSLITLGQVPVLLPDRYEYFFDEINNNITTTRTIEMQIAQRCWFWDMFVFNKKFNQKAGQVLSAKYNPL